MGDALGFIYHHLSTGGGLGRGLDDEHGAVLVLGLVYLLAIMFMAL
ncbi:MAG: hypothetical protein IIC41_03520 [Candidatus Marinimicrobia bacterium]|nr:hypothetical protein [Candidatus Neomarinimicrobiota bacterium]